MKKFGPNKTYLRALFGLPRFPPLRALVAAFTDALWARASGVSDGRPLLPPPTCGVDTAFGVEDLGRPLFPPERLVASALSCSR